MINIGFCTHYYTPGAKTSYPASPVNKLLQHHFQPAVDGCQIIADITTADIPILVPNGCNLSKLLPFLRNLTLKDDTLIAF